MIAEVLDRRFVLLELERVRANLAVRLKEKPTRDAPRLDGVRAASTR